MKRFNAAAFGLIASCALPGMIVGFMMVIENGSSLLAPLGFSFVLFPFTLAAALFFGAPLFYIAYRFDFVRWWSSMLGGAITGVIASCIAFPSSPLMSGLLAWALIGAAAGLLFWCFWRQGVDEYP